MWKQRLLHNWHAMRLMRLGIAILLLIAGFQNKDWVTGLFGIFFLYQAVADTSCCGSGGSCYVPARKKPDNAPIEEPADR